MDLRDAARVQQQKARDEKQKAADSKGFHATDIEFPWESEVGRRLLMRDVCVYKPGDLNKVGKEGKTSWDSASYLLMMAHNVERHIISVLTANNLAENAFLMNSVDIRDWSQYTSKKASVKLDPHIDTKLIFFNQFIEDLFKSETPFDLLNDYIPMLNGVTKGAVRKTAVSTTFDSLFDDTDDGEVEEQAMTQEYAETVFDNLEND